MSISSILSSAVSGLVASSAKVATAAHNVANINTDGYLAQEKSAPGVVATQAFGSGVVQVQEIEPSNVNVGKEFIDMMVAEHAYKANAQVIKISEEILKEAIDIKA
jgi:flagellar hook protein FlgE